MDNKTWHAVKASYISLLVARLDYKIIQLGEVLKSLTGLLIGI